MTVPHKHCTAQCMHENDVFSKNCLTEKVWKSIHLLFHFCMYFVTQANPNFDGGASTQNKYLPYCVQGIKHFVKNQLTIIKINDTSLP